MSCNFTFLENDFPVLAQFGQKAEAYLYSDSNSCLMKLGMIGETIVNLMFTYDRIALPADNTAVNRISTLFREGLLTQDLVSILHALRKTRNKAVHENYASISDGKSLLQMSHSLCEWFMQTYGDWNYQNQPFVMPVEETAVPVADKKKEQEKLLAESRAQQKKMEENLKQRQGVVENLKKKEKQLSKQLSDQRKKASQLNKRIDQLIQKEIEEAERRRKEAERLAKQKNSKSKKQAEKMRKDVAVNQQLSNDFVANKGKFAAPITGSYVISNRYGSYKVEGLRNVSLDNKGITLTGPRGANARTVFKGEVTAIFNLGGLYNVIVSHGKYLTVYCNLSRVIVKQGQKVSTNQILGTVATDDSGNATLQFQVRHGKNTLNPEHWIAR